MSTVLRTTGRTDWNKSFSQSGHGSPVGAVTPRFVDELYLDLDSNFYWRSIGNLREDWLRVGEPTGLVWGPDTTFASGLRIGDLFNTDPQPGELNIDLPSLVTVGPISTGGFGVFETFVAEKLVSCSLDIDLSNEAFTSIRMPKLESVVMDLIAYNNPLVEMDFSSLKSVGQFGLDVVDHVLLIEASWSSLETIDEVYYAAYQCPNLTSLLNPKLTDITGLQSVNLGLVIFDNDVLPLVSFPVLVNIGSAMVSGTSVQISDNPLLTSISFPVWIPTDATDLDFTNNALDVTSINHLLARCVSSPTWGNAGEELHLEDGTNAAPTGQGITDKNTLIARGAAVTTN